METKTMTETKTETTTTIPTPADVIAYIWWQLRLTPERVAAVRVLGDMLDGYADPVWREVLGGRFADMVRNIATLYETLGQLHRRPAPLELAVDDLEYRCGFEEHEPKPVAAMRKIKDSLDDAYALAELCDTLVEADASDDVMSEACYNLATLMSHLSERAVYGLTTRQNVMSTWRYADTSTHICCQSVGYVEDELLELLDDEPLESYPAYLIEHAPTGLSFVVGVEGEIHGTPDREKVYVTQQFVEHHIRDLRVGINQDPDDILGDVLYAVCAEDGYLDTSEWNILRVEPDDAEAVA